MVVKTANKEGLFLGCVLLIVDLAAASIGLSFVALVMMHWMIHFVLLQCVSMAIEMTCDRGTLFVRRRFLFSLINQSQLTKL